MTARDSVQILACGLTCLALFAVPSHADATFTQRMKIRGGGEMDRIEVVRKVRIHQDKAREESITKFAGPAARDAGAMPVASTTIVRLDRGAFLFLEPQQRTFSERSLLDERARLLDVAAEADTSTGCAEAPDASPAATVHSTPEVRRIGSWDATLTRIAVRTLVIDLRTGEKRDADVTLDLWMARDVPGQDDIRAYEAARAARLGIAGEIFSLAGLSGGYEKSMAKIRQEYLKLPGYPVRWTWTVRTALSPEDRADLVDAAKLEEEGADPSQKQEEIEGSQSIQDPLAAVETRSPESAQDKNRPHPQEPSSGVDTKLTGADQETDTEQGTTLILRVEAIVEAVDGDRVDPSLFEVPPGTTAVPH
jgi:hypothetical protein